MSDAGDTERCGRCGAEFAATSSPLGLCPACLLKLGMSDPAMAPPAEPEPEPVAPLAPVPPASGRQALPPSVATCLDSGRCGPRDRRCRLRLLVRATRS